MGTGSSETGQGALLMLPSKSMTAKRHMEEYQLPRELVAAAKLKDQGMDVLKVTKSGKLQARRIGFSQDRRHVVVTTNKIKSVRGLFKAATGREANAKVLPLSLVDRIQRGCNTERFWNVQGDPHIVQKLLDNAIDTVSIIYYSVDSQKLESLDLIVPDPVGYEVLLTSLEDLTSMAKEERLWLTRPIHFLHYQWALRQKSLKDSMTGPEFVNMVETTGTRLTKTTLQSMFKEDCQMHNLSDTLPMGAVGMLMEDVREAQMPKDNPLETLWNELVQTDPVPEVALQDQKDDDSLEMKIRDEEESISAVVFLSFVRSRQKQYSATLEHVSDLIRVLNQQQAPEELMMDSLLSSTSARAQQKRHRPPSDRLPKSRFLSYLQSDANDIMDPVRGKFGVDDMTQPLSAYWIHTSHDTYLKNVGHSLETDSAKNRYHLNDPIQEVDGQAYMAALYRGVRCIELDIWEDERQNPVVSRFAPPNTSPTSNNGGVNGEKTNGNNNSNHTILLTRVLRIVRHFLEANPYSFPIILNIENHCKAEGHLKVAKLLYNILGAAKMIVEPERDLNDNVPLPSPEQGRGKVVILSKRPKVVQPGAKVMNDDFDAENHSLDKSPVKVAGGEVPFDSDVEVVGFSSVGPIYNKDPRAFLPTPGEVYERAASEANETQAHAKELVARATALEAEASEKDSETSTLTAKAGMTSNEVRKRALAAASGRNGQHNNHSRNGANSESDVYLMQQKSATEDEGVELHEVLPEFVAGGKDRYAQAAQAAMEAGNRVTNLFTFYNEADTDYQEAQKGIERAKQREQDLRMSAEKAANEARSHREFADAARTRVETVRELQRSAEENSSSAGNVVVTALTEAKISEKRAEEAESRALRAKTVAEKDRKRADVETRKEEELENEVSRLHGESNMAAESAQEARQRVEKAAAMLDRVNEQVTLIESSSQYRKEKQMGVSAGGGGRHGSSFVAKRAAKLEERETCRELIKEASAANATAEQKMKKIYKSLEERNNSWKVQGDVASQARKVADRSTHVADELAEHAEEEREAAKLRFTARQRAEATVQSRDSHTQSLQTQLVEAERASSEASSIAVQSRKRATRLASEAERAKDHDQYHQILKDAEWKRNQRKGEYDSALLEKDRCDKNALEEKRRLDTNAEVANQARRDAAEAINRIKYEHLYQQEAIVAFNAALNLRSQAEDARRRSKAATAKAEEKVIAAKRARDYKIMTDRVVEIPTNLARLTLLHRAKFKDWDTSLKLSNAYTHSLSQHVLFEMVSRSPAEHRNQLQTFANKHLIRAFPSWKAVPKKAFTNYDPIFAWSLGCQMVAMNLHSVDERVFVADGRFRSNGSCGYVLKPKGLLDSSRTEKENWSFDILCGFQIPNSSKKSVSPNLFVKVSLFAGSTSKEKSAFYKTSVQHIHSNPVWAGNNFLFSVDNPAVAIMVFSVWDQSGSSGAEEFVAASAVPVSCLREGYRSVPLFDEDHSRSGPYAFASLLVNATQV